MFQPKDPAARKFVRQFDKFTIILCGTAAIAYGLQQYYVSAPRNTYFTSSRSPDPSTRRDWTAHRGRYRRRSSFQRLRKAVLLRNREVRCRDKTRPELSHRQRVRTKKVEHDQNREFAKISASSPSSGSGMVRGRRRSLV